MESLVQAPVNEPVEDTDKVAKISGGLPAKFGFITIYNCGFIR